LSIIGKIHIIRVMTLLT